VFKLCTSKVQTSSSNIDTPLSNHHTYHRYSCLNLCIYSYHSHLNSTDAHGSTNCEDCGNDGHDIYQIAHDSENHVTEDWEKATARSHIPTLHAETHKRNIYVKSSQLQHWLSLNPALFGICMCGCAHSCVRARVRVRSSLSPPLVLPRIISLAHAHAHSLICAHFHCTCALLAEVPFCWT